MTFQTQLLKFDSPLWAFHFLVSEELVAELVQNHGRRVVCTVNESKSFQCALMPHGDGDWFINVNKKIRDELSLVEDQMISVQLEADTSTFGMEMPEEFEEMLHQDEEGKAHFEKLTPGKQRNLIYIAGQVKSPHIRLRRALVLVNHLKIHNGVIDFKALNVELKKSNQEAARG
jgi:hypothetical protein